MQTDIARLLSSRLIGEDLRRRLSPFRALLKSGTEGPGGAFYVNVRRHETAERPVPAGGFKGNLRGVEPARAGRAGKGSEVVGGELRRPDLQTAKATDEVPCQMGVAHAATRSTVDGIHAVKSTINSISEIAAAIATNAGERFAAIRRIARKIEAVSTSPGETTRSIGSMNEAVGETVAADPVLLSACELSHQSEALSDCVDGFLHDATARDIQNRSCERLDLSDILSGAGGDLLIGAIVLHRNGLIVAANRSFVEMTGRGRTCMIGSDLFSVFNPRQAKVLRQADANGQPTELMVNFSDGIGGGRPVCYRSRVLRDGTRFVVLLSTATLDEREVALTLERERFRDFAEVATDWLWETDQDHRIVFHTGIDLVQNLGLPSPVGYSRWSYPGADTSAGDLWTRHRQDLDAQRPFSGMRYRLRIRSGGWAWVEISGRPFYDSLGRFRGYRGSARDVTGAVVEQEALRQSESRTLAILNTVADAIIVINGLGVIQSFNPWAENMFGYTAEEAVGRNVSVLMAEKNALARGGYLKRYRRPGIPDVLGRGRRITAKRKNGEIFPAELSVSEVSVPTGAIFIGIIRDVSEEVERQDALIRERAKLRAVFDNQTMGLFLFGEDGTLEYANATGEGILVRHGLLGLELGNRDMPGWWEQLVPRSALRALIKCEEIRFVKDLEGRIYDITVRPVNSTIGVIGRVVSVLDVTRQKEFEVCLREAKEAAEAASEAKTRFLANLSHELRTPLNAILGYSEMISLGLHGPIEPLPYAEYNASILTSARHLRDMVEDLLDMARLELDASPVKVEETDLAAVVREAITMMRGFAADKDIRLDVDLPNSLELVVDRRAIKQVLLNLLRNSLKFTGRDGSVTVTADAGGLITVSDTGAGIPAEKLETVFAAFQTSDPTQADPERGIGLGLPIVRGLVEAHGGTVEIKSDVGRGTTVRVDLRACIRTKKAIEVEGESHAH